MADNTTATGGPIDELGERAFRLSRHLSEVSKFLLALGLLAGGGVLLSGLASDDSSGPVAGVLGGVAIGLASWVQYLVMAGFAVLIEMKAYEMFFLGDEDE